MKSDGEAAVLYWYMEKGYEIHVQYQVQPPF